MDNIIITNSHEFERKKSKIITDGAPNLQVIADFDKTLTPAYVNGKNITSLYAHLRDGDYLTEEYVKKAHELHDKYRPYEIDPALSYEEKTKMMIEWWQTHLKILVKSGMNKKVIEDIIAKDKIKARISSLEMLDILHSLNIPTLIFSSGLGDLIEGFLKKQGRLYNNVHIISNFYNYDKDGNVLGYKNHIIHSLNKKEIELKETPYYEEAKQRKNVLLLGDSLDDIHMSEGIPHDTIIRVAFMNKDTEKHIEEFKKCYDVLLLNDCSMDFVVDFLKGIKG